MRAKESKREGERGRERAGERGLHCQCETKLAFSELRVGGVSFAAKGIMI